MTFGEATTKYPEYRKILDRINYLAALEESLTEAQERELAVLHVLDEEWRKKLDLN